MATIIAMEFKKMMRSRGMRAALLAGALIVVLQTGWSFRHIYLENEQSYRKIAEWTYGDPGYGRWFECTILEGWLGCESFSSYNMLYFLILPILAVMPYGLSFYNEWQSTYSAQIIVRCGRGKYLWAKYLATFISGGIAAALPLLLSLLLSACYLPAIPTDPVSLQTVLMDRSMWAFLYFEHPVCYALAYTGLDFVYGGLFACITMTAARWLRNRFGAAMLPVLLHCIGYYCIYNLLPETESYLFSLYLDPNQSWGMVGEISTGPVVLTTVLLAAAVTGIFIGSNRKRDVLTD